MAPVTDMDKYTEKDLENLEKRLENQKLLNKQGKIDPDVFNLNRIALTKTIKAVTALRSGETKDPKTGLHIEGINEEGNLEDFMNITAKGIPPPFVKDVVEVYEDRSNVMFFVFLCMASAMVFQVQDWRIIAVSGLLMYFWYDIFSGILHVVLDEPKNLRSWRKIILYKPCLEFQWHHVIPADIASKGINQSCGDLNIIILYVFIVAMGVFQIYKYPVPMCLAGWKILFSYFGQYCHKMAHTIESERPQFVKIAQNLGIMISEQAHRVHHTNPHDDNFCIGSGVFQGLIRNLTKITLNPNVWFAALGLTLFFDFFAFSFIVEKLF